GELNSLDLCYYEGKFERKPIQVDAYSWDTTEEEGVFSLVICDFSLSEDPQPITGPEINRLLMRLVDFSRAARSREFREGLEETSNAFGLSDLLVRIWKKISKIKLILVTNRINKAKKDADPIGKIGGIPVTSNVWDL